MTFQAETSFNEEFSFSYEFTGSAVTNSYDQANFEVDEFTEYDNTFDYLEPNDTPTTGEDDTDRLASYDEAPEDDDDDDDDDLEDDELEIEELDEAELGTEAEELEGTIDDDDTTQDLMDETADDEDDLEEDEVETDDDDDDEDEADENMIAGPRTMN